MSLTLPDGRTVILGDRTPGGSKNETRFARLSDGQQVVVKVQAHYGQLDAEEDTLRFLAPTPVRVPGVVGSGTTSDGRQFLVITSEDGVRAKDPDGWRRFGRDLAALTRVPVDHWRQETVPVPVFVADHRQRLAVVAPILDRALADRIGTAIDQVATSDRLAFTHGDPGSGNYLDNGDVGVILDWETASVSPFGLDAGRAAFIGLMDHGATGRPAELYAAFVDGYRTALHDPAALDNNLLTAWVTVAGLQFIHGRLTHPLRPERTPQVAANVLQRFLETV